MAKLLKAQIDHARVMLQQIAKDKTEKAAKALGDKPVGPAFTFAQRVALIRSGHANLKPIDQLHAYTDLEDAYTYPAHEKAKANHAKLYDAYMAKYEAIAARIEAQAARVLDTIMLGGADPLQAIEDFKKAK